MDHHENLLSASSDLGEALLEPLTDAGVAAMLAMTDAIIARLALAAAEAGAAGAA